MANLRLIKDTRDLKKDFVLVLHSDGDRWVPVQYQHKGVDRIPEGFFFRTFTVEMYPDWFEETNEEPSVMIEPTYTYRVTELSEEGETRPAAVEEGSTRPDDTLYLSKDIMNGIPFLNEAQRELLENWELRQKKKEEYLMGKRGMEPPIIEDNRAQRKRKSREYDVTGFTKEEDFRNIP